MRHDTASACHRWVLAGASGWLVGVAGTVPCADCSGINETIIFYTDKTYVDQNVYQERDVTSENKGTSFYVSFPQEGMKHKEGIKQLV